MDQRMTPDTLARGLVLGLAGLADTRLLPGVVKLAIKAGVQKFDAVSPASGKEVGTVLAGLETPVDVAVGTTSTKGLDSHKGAALVVQNAFNGAGIRRAHTLVLPWLPDAWAGELGRTMESLREISLFRQVVVLVADPDEAHAALDADGVDGVRLPMAQLRGAGEAIPNLALKKNKRLQLGGFLTPQQTGQPPGTLSRDRVEAMQELSEETGLGPVDLTLRYLLGTYPMAEIVADVFDPALTASLLQGTALIAPDGLSIRLTAIFQGAVTGR